MVGLNSVITQGSSIVAHICVMGDTSHHLGRWRAYNHILLHYVETCDAVGESLLIHMTIDGFNDLITA